MYKSPVGEIEISATSKGITSLFFKKVEILNPNPSPLIQNCILQLQEYFEGKRKIFTLSLDIQGTEFQIKVWTELLKIPYGSTKTYLDISRAIGDQKATRAVGNANGKNKISIVIPCHRVIGADGKLTGYAGGLHIKKWLLDFERKSHQTELFE